MFSSNMVSSNIHRLGRGSGFGYKIVTTKLSKNPLHSVYVCTPQRLHGCGTGLEAAKALRVCELREDGCE